MRPIRLELKGFTAFRDAQTIVFEGLDLFAIAGPTGSGKTSILDAITYALYGEIERVGRQAGQFVSQGQTRMAVLFEFAVDGERYRVTRSTPARTGSTKVLVERWDGEWRQAGEGADRVREANEMIRRAVGLDYDTFTRTVLLPQGRFAEFLVGDARQRRDILTDLLGLELFGRLARRAGDIKRDATVAVEMHERLLATEYAGVTPDAVAEAEAVAKEAAGRDASLADAETAVRAVAERWADTSRAIRELQTCARDVRDAAATAAGVAQVLEELMERAAGADADVTARSKSLAAAEKDVQKARATREKAEASWGTAIELARQRVRAESLLEAREVQEEAESELAAALVTIPALEASAVAAAERVTIATADAEAAIAALEGADRALEEARHADLVAAVRRGIHVGEGCPVCGTTIARLPKAVRAVSLEKAEAMLAKASAQATAANAALTEAQRSAHTSAAEVEVARKDAARCERAAAKAAKDTDALGATLAEALGRKLPEDPMAEIDDRIERLEDLATREGHARDAATEAREALTAAERAREGLSGEVGQARARLESVAITGLLDRTREAAGGVVRLPELPLVAGVKDPTALAAVAAGVAEGLGRLAEDLEERAETDAGAESEVFAEAVAPLEGLVDVRSSLVTELIGEVAAARTEATRACATAEDRAEQVRTRLANAAAIVEQVADHRVRGEVFGELAKELQANRLVAFLQAEALALLAAAGSARLRTLSSDRYRLEYADEEFSVVDTWNGEERRSAKTLSGGETFLASLALALALSEQVRSLAVTQKARLDSLFLDEGFGTLDPESLEVVVEAIEQLGGDGRMVGVITHVQELAIRLPARIEVEKSPRGSTLRVVA